jgi:hypothetical protein
MDPDLRAALEQIDALNVRLDSTRWAFVLEDLDEIPAADAAVGLGYADIIWDEGDDVCTGPCESTPPAPLRSPSKARPRP